MTLTVVIQKNIGKLTNTANKKWPLVDKLSVGCNLDVYYVSCTSINVVNLPNVVVPHRLCFEVIIQLIHKQMCKKAANTRSLIEETKPSQ